MRNFVPCFLTLVVIGFLLGLVTSCSTPPTAIPTLPAVVPTLSTEDVIATNVAIQRAVAATLTAIPSPSPSSTLSSMPTIEPSPVSVTVPPRQSTLILTPRISVPELLEPSQGGTYKNPMTFQWNGSLGASDKYQVTTWHVETGHTLQSGLLADSTWSTDVPAINIGEWRWKVSVIRNGMVLTTSAERMFWFNPFPKTPGSHPSGLPPTPTTGPYP